MADAEHNELISVVKWFMVAAGLWRKNLSRSPILNKLFALYSVFMRLNYSILYLALIAEMLRLIIKGYEVQLILLSFSVVANATKIAVKVIIYFKNNVLDMLDDIGRKEKEIWEKNETDIKELYLKNIKLGKLFSFMLGSSTITVVLYIFFSATFGYVQLKRYNEANNATLEPHIAYQFWFPGNKLDHLVLVNSLNFVFLCAGTSYSITTHVVLVTLLVYSCTYLSLLQYRLRTYIPEKLDDDQMNETLNALKGLVLEHQYLIDFTEKLNARCKNIVMMEFIFSSFDVASTAMLIIKLDAAATAWILFFFFMLIIQIFCLSWSCNELSYRSQEVADAAFRGNWYLLNKEGKMLTQIIIARAQKPLYMTIGPFGPMTTQSFLLMMKAAYSYVSIMKQ